MSLLSQMFELDDLLRGLRNSLSLNVARGEVRINGDG